MLRRELIGGIKSLDGYHVRAIDERCQIQTAGHCAPIHEHSAAAAESLAAGFARTGETKVPLQKLDQVVVRRNICRDGKAIEREIDRALPVHITRLPAAFRPSPGARDRLPPD